MQSQIPIAPWMMDLSIYRTLDDRFIDMVGACVDDFSTAADQLLGGEANDIAVTA